jgi:hypothetical protein
MTDAQRLQPHQLVALGAGGVIASHDCLARLIEQNKISLGEQV